MTGVATTRRGFVRLVAASLAALAGLRPGWGDPLDRGIGGTGAAPDDPDDRGIGGTGVVGTVRGLDGMLVNDQRIGYRADAMVTVDGRAARPAALRVGHVVRVLARTEAGALTAGRIEITHELVGRIQSVARDKMVVLGQTVVAAGPQGLHPPGRRWRVGDRVAVSGMRNPDGTVVASLVEASRRGEDRIVGLVRRGANGTLSIGGLEVTGADAAPGARSVLTGRLRGRRFVAARSASELSFLSALGAARYSIESLVKRGTDGIAVGDAYRADAAPAPDVPADRVVRAVLTARVTAREGLVVEAIRLAGAGRGPGGAPPGAAQHQKPGPGTAPGASGPAGHGMPGGPGTGAPPGHPGAQGPAGGSGRR